MPARHKASTVDIILGRIRRDGECWLYTGSIHDGYADIYTPRPEHKRLRGHVVMWEAENGPVLRGVVLHHTCRQKSCVNPAHLQPMTRAAHSRVHTGERCALCDGTRFGRIATTGRRYCRDCAARWKRERQARLAG